LQSDTGVLLAAGDICGQSEDKAETANGRSSFVNDSENCGHDSHHPDMVIDLEQPSELSSGCDEMTADNGDVIIDVTSATESSVDDRKPNSLSGIVGKSSATEVKDKCHTSVGHQPGGHSESPTKTDEYSEFKSSEYLLSLCV